MAGGWLHARDDRDMPASGSSATDWALRYFGGWRNATTVEVPAAPSAGIASLRAGRAGQLHDRIRSALGETLGCTVVHTPQGRSQGPGLADLRQVGRVRAHPSRGRYRDDLEQNRRRGREHRPALTDATPNTRPGAHRGAGPVMSERAGPAVRKGATR